MAENKQRELVLADNQTVLIQDGSTGTIYVTRGAHKEALAAEFKFVKLVGRTFVVLPSEEELSGIRAFTVAREGQYVVLMNPAVDTTKKMSKGKNEAIPLEVGKSVVIRGPVEFPLWPGQEADVIDGHSMTVSQYIRIRITGEISQTDAASLRALIREDWQQNQKEQTEAPLAIGSEYLVRGRMTSFFIPPTGVTVLKADDRVTSSRVNGYVMNGVQLDADEYAKLRNRTGRISYVRGSTTVIPCEDQVFETVDVNNPKFKAVSIDENSGVLLRTLVELTPDEIQRRIGDARIVFAPVSGLDEDRLDTADFERTFLTPMQSVAAEPPPEEIEHSGGNQEQIESKKLPDESAAKDETTPTEEIKELGSKLPPGTELVIWRQKRLIFPVDGIEIVRKFCATHILPGTARYVKNLLTGKTRIVKGEVLYLTDPRCEEFVTRRIPQNVIDLWFPGSTGNEYDPELVPCITIPQGTAATIQRNGSEDQKTTRRVICGFAAYFLEWDETLATMRISGSRAGQPKDYKEARTICYLWIQGNRINDTTICRSREDCEIELKFTLTVDFDSDKRNAWFNVDDYVYLVCEEVRAKLRGGLLATPIDELATNYVDIIRDIALGIKPPGGHREGILFPRFGARLVDIYVNSFFIQDPKLRARLAEIQMLGIDESVQTRMAALRLNGLKQRAEIAQERQRIEIEVATIDARKDIALSAAEEERKRKQAAEADMTRLAATKLEHAQLLLLLKNEEILAQTRMGAETEKNKHAETIAQIRTSIAKQESEIKTLDLEIEQHKLEMARTDANERMSAHAEAAAAINASILPSLGAHLEQLANSVVAKDIVNAFGATANFRGIQVVELAAQSLSALPGISNVLARLGKRSSSKD
jgi:hypothetical protein